jgi:hypothetical protein
MEGNRDNLTCVRRVRNSRARLPIMVEKIRKKARSFSIGRRPRANSGALPDPAIRKRVLGSARDFLFAASDVLNRCSIVD